MVSNSFFYLQSRRSLFQAFRDRSKYTGYNWCHRHFYVLQLCLPSGKYLSILSSFIFTLSNLMERQKLLNEKFFSLCYLMISLFCRPEFGDLKILENFNFTLWFAETAKIQYFFYARFLLLLSFGVVVAVVVVVMEVVVVKDLVNIPFIYVEYFHIIYLYLDIWWMFKKCRDWSCIHPGGIELWIECSFSLIVVSLAFNILISGTFPLTDVCLKLYF